MRLPRRSSLRTSLLNLGSGAPTQPELFIEWEEKRLVGKGLEISRCRSQASGPVSILGVSTFHPHSTERLDVFWDGKISKMTEMCWSLSKCQYTSMCQQGHEDPCEDE